MPPNLASFMSVPQVKKGCGAPILTLTCSNSANNKNSRRSLRSYSRQMTSINVAIKKFLSHHSRHMVSVLFKKRIDFIIAYLLRSLFPLSHFAFLRNICVIVMALTLVCWLSQLDLKRVFNPNFEKLRKKTLKKYVCQHDFIAILATHPVK